MPSRSHACRRPSLTQQQESEHSPLLRSAEVHLAAPDTDLSQQDDPQLAAGRDGPHTVDTSSDGGGQAPWPPPYEVDA
jgi:hypothetical protein